MNKKTLSAICAVLVAVILILVCGIGSSWFTNGNIGTWFNSWGKDKNEQFKDSDDDEGAINSGLIAGDDVENNGIRFMATSIPVALYEDYGVSAVAETALQLTVTPKNSGADLSDGAFSIKFKNASSTWASGKTLSQHVTLSQSDSTHATVSCLLPFGEQIIVVYTFTGESNNEIKTMTAEYPLDYAKRITGVSITGSSSTAANVKEGDIMNSSIKLVNEKVTYSYTLTYGDGTVEDTFNIDEDNSFVEFTARAADGLKSLISRYYDEFYIISSSENGKVTFDLTEIVSALEIENNLIKSNVKATIDDLSGRYQGPPEGVIVIYLRFTGNHSEYMAQLTSSFDISAFGEAAQGVQFQDGGHVF